MNLRCKIPPVFAGIGIGISIVLAFVIAGRGIGASGALTRIIAVAQNAIIPEITQSSEYFARYFSQGQNPLNNWLLYLFAGLLLGSFVASLLCGEFKLEVLRGPNISVAGRLLLALSGGILIGFAARLARGCTSGLALVGGAELAVGAWAFMLCVFAGGYAAAYFVRRQWL
jgi:uncharacterized membrane protein YedE/YeeE